MFSRFVTPTEHCPACARALQAKQAQKLRASYHGGNVQWTMFSRFATSKNFLRCPHTEQGRKFPVNVQRKCPVVLPELYSVCHEG